MITAHAIRCERCGDQQHYGYLSAPSNIESCGTSRAMRMRCKDRQCKFVLRTENVELTHLDKLRVGLREDEEIQNGA